MVGSFISQAFSARGVPRLGLRTNCVPENSRFPSLNLQLIFTGTDLNHGLMWLLQNPTCQFESRQFNVFVYVFSGEIKFLFFNTHSNVENRNSQL